MAAYEMLRGQGRKPLLVSVPMVQPLDADGLLDLFSSVGHVICVEEHYANCGLGSMIARLKAGQSTGWRLTILGIPPRFIHDVRDPEGLRSSFSLSPADIVHAVVSEKA